MYIPAAFHETRPEVIADFIRQHSFATVVTHDAEAGLCASHVPVLFTPAAENPATLTFHVARQNPQCSALRPDADALVIFQGPHAYISPRWYQEKIAVPTWNYTAVHAYGRPTVITDEAAIRKVLSQTVVAYEGSGKSAWTDAVLPAQAAEKLIAQIAFFSLAVTRLEAKFKLNQNRSTADRNGVIAALESSPGQDNRAIAALMRERTAT